ncbi:uncharacterized protein SAPINGB_P003560 [Magnusiomyces paraingens]|uniref:DNA primase n=1 Tax=Magnusiomyces paraingens TaxID=2606893 RepID=A0A5E8BQV8_9ASCO|nr:uncharacterized protein SAPINGB_P003560 [Saprochaete ingens]VVT53411.1 unnamed protein product [Saprochaete ingens]
MPNLEPESPPKAVESSEKSSQEDLDELDELDELNDAELGELNQSLFGKEPANDSRLTPEMMLQFYQHFFPYRLFFQWLNQGLTPSTSFRHREIAFTLSNDAYLRYQSFPTAEAFRREVLRLNPARFEVGPVYSADPKDRKLLDKSQFRPLRKELVFDIDLTDYDDVRTCCTGKDICSKCWRFVTAAIKIMDSSLRSDFGFQHILWVYSGRRGAHAWVCDKRAMAMDDSRRSAVAGYLQLRRKGDASSDGLLKRPLHPQLMAALGVLQQTFKQDILVDQDPWGSRPGGSETLLKRLRCGAALETELRSMWAKESKDEDDEKTSVDRWDDIDVAIQHMDKGSVNPRRVRDAKVDLILETMYPRLDVEVSRHLNHLLKSPFCVHPATGRVCVPIDIEHVDEFDPLHVPTVSQLLDELDAWKDDNEDETTRLSDAEKTSLGPYVKIFKDFASRLTNEGLHEKRQREEGSMDF